MLAYYFSCNFGLKRHLIEQVSAVTVKVSYENLGRPSPFCMFMISYILREKVSSLIQTDITISELMEFFGAFSNTVYYLPSTLASMRAVRL